ncbi:SecDF P1 head subdomain-containing protein [Pendulispora albinea]|uniref:SecDF P1 head subdomain domain-containing protein n=1 Tax=Pendulispora albinea TaxID=2741071 RepID=A0ABZ2M779_9BACT
MNSRWTGGALALMLAAAVACGSNAQSQRPVGGAPSLTQGSTVASVNVELRLVATAGGEEVKTVEGAVVHLEKEVVLSQADIVEAHASGSNVELRLTPGGARALHDVTSANVGRKLAAVVDGTVQATPVIREAIQGEHLVISLRSSQEAGALAQRLASSGRAGPPAK